jgi:hypothetical protein
MLMRFDCAGDVPWQILRTKQTVNSLALTFSVAPIVRLQMLWDNARIVRPEALLGLIWSLSGFQAVLQLSVFDGVAFDPLSLKQDGVAFADVDIGRRQVL